MLILGQNGDVLVNVERHQSFSCYRRSGEGSSPGDLGEVRTIPAPERRTGDTERISRCAGGVLGTSKGLRDAEGVGGVLWQGKFTARIRPASTTRAKM